MPKGSFKFMPLLFGVATLCNVLLCYRASSVATRVHDITNHVEVVSFTTNFVNLSSMPTNIISSQTDVRELPREVARTAYQYFVVGRLIGCKAWGRYYYDGSPCSWGRISAVYPDRILLEDGNWISNTFAFDEPRRKKDD